MIEVHTSVQSALEHIEYGKRCIAMGYRILKIMGFEPHREVNL